jgi:hypothetical protein
MQSKYQNVFGKVAILAKRQLELGLLTGLMFQNARSVLKMFSAKWRHSLIHQLQARAEVSLQKIRLSEQDFDCEPGLMAHYKRNKTFWNTLRYAFWTRL